MTEINLRKTFARFVYFIEQSSTGNSKEKILKELGLTNEEFQFLLTRALIISKLNDKEANLITPVDENKIPIAGCLLRFNNKDLMSL